MLHLPSDLSAEDEPIELAVAMRQGVRIQLQEVSRAGDPVFALS